MEIIVSSRLHYHIEMNLTEAEFDRLRVHPQELRAGILAAAPIAAPRLAAPAPKRKGAHVPKGAASSGARARLLCPKCDRPFKNQGWLDRHVARCPGKSAPAAS